MKRAGELFEVSVCDLGFRVNLFLGFRVQVTSMIYSPKYINLQIRINKNLNPTYLVIWSFRTPLGLWK